LKEHSNKEMQTVRIERKANKNRPKGNANQKVIADNIVKEMQSGRQGAKSHPTNTHLTHTSKPTNQPTNQQTNTQISKQASEQASTRMNN